MKRLIAAIVLIIGLAALCIGSIITINNSSKDFAQQLATCKSAVEVKDYTTAKNKSIALAKNWKTKRGVLSIFINHMTVEEIDEAVAQLSSFANKENEAHFLAECELLELKLTEMKEYCSISLHTLF